MRKKFCAVLLGLSAAHVLANTSAAAADAPSGAQAERIDALFADYAQPGSPGCALAMYRHGEIVYAKGYGLASLEHGAAIQPLQTVFNLGSTSKQFTAASVLLLVQDGHLKLDDEIHQYLPELPDYGNPITVEQLLHHTSGLRDYTMLMGLSSIKREDHVTAAQTRELIARQKNLDFLPGSKHSYSNSGYVLLAEIVKRVSGQSLREFARRRLFEPLGMRNTHYQDDHEEVIPHKAASYEPLDETGYAAVSANWEALGDGSLHTTVADLARWEHNFYAPTVGGQWLVDELQRPGKLGDGTPLSYAGGLMLGEYRGHPIVSHAGSQNGYRAELLRLPQQQLAVATLCNVADSDPIQLARRVVDVVLNLQPDAPVAHDEVDVPEVEQPVTDPSRFTGVYWSPAAGAVRRIEWRDGQLFYVRGSGSRSELVPLDGERLAMRGVPMPTELRLTPGRDGRHLSVSSGGGKPTEFDEVKAFAPDATQLAAYVGRYHSDELATDWEFRLVDGQLVFVQPRYPEQALQPVFSEAFQFEFLLMRFRRDGNQHVTGFTVDAGRARGLQFVRADD